MSGKFHCSFCGKNQDDVLRLIAGPGTVFICDECVGICCEIERDARIETAARRIIKTELVELKKSIERIERRRSRFLVWVLKKMGLSA